jgi:hypothetical protein
MSMRSGTAIPAKVLSILVAAARCTIPQQVPQITTGHDAATVIYYAPGAGHLRRTVAEALGDYVVDGDYDSFSHACDAAASSGKPLAVVRSWSALPTQTCSANLKFYPARGASLQPAVGATLTLKGSVEAGVYQIFDASLGGRVAGLLVREAYPEWWGAKGDGIADDSQALNAAVSVAHRLCFLSRKYRVSSPIDLTNKPAGPFQMEGSGWGMSGLGSTIVCDTGTVCIDASGSAYITLRDLSLAAGATNPSVLGILYARTTAVHYAPFDSLENIRISLNHDPTANGGVGTIGIYNFAAENWRYNGGYVAADLPIVFTSQNIYSISSPFRPLISGTSSMSVADLSGGIALTALGGAAVTLHIVADINLGDTYLLKGKGNSYDFAIAADTATDVHHSGSIESFHRLLTTSTQLSGLCITSRIYPTAGKSLIHLNGSTPTCCAAISNSDIRMNLGANYDHDLIDGSGVNVAGVTGSTMTIAPLETFTLRQGHVDNNLFIVRNALSSITLPTSLAGTANGNLIVASDGVAMTTLIGSANRVLAAGPNGVLSPYTPGGFVPACAKYNVAYTDGGFQVAASTADVTLFTLPARGKIIGVNIKHSVAFAGTQLANTTVSVGNGSPPYDQFAAPFDISQPPASTVFQDTSEFKSATMSAAAVSAHFSAGVDFGRGDVAIRAARNANPVQLTAQGHRLVTGNPATIGGATGKWSGINGSFTVTRIDDDNFAIPVDSRDLGALSGSPVLKGSFLTAGAVDIDVCSVGLP